MISGSYPALFLSSFQPIRVLKGTLRFSPATAWFRKGLVVFQFVLSIVLIIGTIVVSGQLNYVQSINLGYDRENLVYVPLDGDLAGKYKLFKEDALQLPGVSGVSRLSQPPTNIENGTSGVDWDGKDPNNTVMFTETAAGYDLVRTMDLQMVKGREYSPAFGTDSVGFLLNEEAARRIGYKDPIGKRLTFWGKKGTIVGVVRN